MRLLDRTVTGVTLAPDTVFVQYPAERLFNNWKLQRFYTYRNAGLDQVLCGDHHA